jgi:hypothetical protein
MATSVVHPLRESCQAVAFAPAGAWCCPRVTWPSGRLPRCGGARWTPVANSAVAASRTWAAAVPAAVHGPTEHVGFAVPDGHHEARTEEDRQLGHDDDLVVVEVLHRLEHDEQRVLIDAEFGRWCALTASSTANAGSPNSRATTAMSSASAAAALSTRSPTSS